MNWEEINYFLWFSIYKFFKLVLSFSYRMTTMHANVHPSHSIKVAVYNVRINFVCTKYYSTFSFAISATHSTFIVNAIPQSAHKRMNHSFLINFHGNWYFLFANLMIAAPRQLAFFKTFQLFAHHRTPAFCHSFVITTLLHFTLIFVSFSFWLRYFLCEKTYAGRSETIDWIATLSEL